MKEKTKKIKQSSEKSDDHVHGRRIKLDYWKLRNSRGAKNENPIAKRDTGVRSSREWWKTENKKSGLVSFYFLFTLLRWISVTYIHNIIYIYWNIYVYWHIFVHAHTKCPAYTNRAIRWIMGLYIILINKHRTAHAFAMTTLFCHHLDN